MKNSMSRFQIHDDLTAPEGSVPVLRGALATGGQLPNFLGVLAGSPAALRAYARFRSELRHGRLKIGTLERIALIRVRVAILRRLKPQRMKRAKHFADKNEPQGLGKWPRRRFDRAPRRYIQRTSVWCTACSGRAIR